MGDSKTTSVGIDFDGADSAERLAAVEALMCRLADGDGDDPLGGIVGEHLSTGGKRLRARLALAATAALGGSADAAVPWAAACELLHNATLIHDDLQDGDRVRRGSPTVWVNHGAPQAINAGDLMLMLPYAAVNELGANAEVRAGLMTALARRTLATVRGQAIELELPAKLSSDNLRHAYLRGIEGKTSALFLLPVEGAALVAGMSVDDATAVAAPFRQLGLLFQIQDDVLDLYGEKGRELPGSDLGEGKVSYLVVEHLRRCPDDATWLVNLLTTPREDTSQDDVERAIALFRESGTLASVTSDMRAMADELLSAPALVAHPALHRLAKHFVELVLAPVSHVMDAAPKGAMAAEASA